jgi:hypothetical protein
VGRGCTLATVGNGCRLLVSQARDEALDVRETDPPAARVEPEAGFEPATPCLQDRCSDRLSYSGARRESMGTS